MEPGLAASVIVKNSNNVWIDDGMVSNCNGCRLEFSFFVRKHHCRNCGNIFCYNCTNQYIVIPEFIKDRADPADYWNISYYVKPLKTAEEKVCFQCYDLIKTKTKTHTKILEILSNPVSIDKINELPNSNIDLKNYYFNHLRNIQYYLPNQKYTTIDQKLLRVNALYLSKHSKYLMHLIKSVDWEDCGFDFLSRSNANNATSASNLSNLQSFTDTPAAPTYTVCENLKLITTVINSDKNKTCSELLCTRTCREQLSCDDCINILYSCTGNLPNSLIKYLFEIIMKTPEQVILCHLSFFVNLVKVNSVNKMLQTHLFNLLDQSTKLNYHTYWFLNNAREKANLQEIENINEFIKLFNTDLVAKMYKEYMFFAGLIDNLDDPKKYLLNVFEKYKPITLPYEPDIQLVQVCVDNINIKSSYTKPVIIPFITNTGENINLLFKKESVMNDVTVLNLMTLCDIILSENLNQNFDVVVYPVMPLTPFSGVIEIIDQAETIHSINNKKKSIIQHIMEENNDKVIGEVLDRYMYSLVSYTLHSYFLGLGDRHLQNIMITNDGAIFHIDFGFILGTDAYPLNASDIKLNSDMLDVIGVSAGDRYQNYLGLCSAGIMLLRKYFGMFFILLAQDSNFSEKYIEKFVMARFQPRQNDNVIVTELISIIKQSNNAYSDKIRDFLHYHTQEKTLQNGVRGIIKTAFSAVKSITNSN